MEDAGWSAISSILKITQGGQEEGGGEEGELTAASALLNIVTIFPYKAEDEDEDERIAVIKVNVDIYSSRTLPWYNDLDDIQRTLPNL